METLLSRKDRSQFSITVGKLRGLFTLSALYLITHRSFRKFQHAKEMRDESRKEDAAKNNNFCAIYRTILAYFQILRVYTPHDKYCR